MNTFLFQVHVFQFLLLFLGIVTAIAITSSAIGLKKCSLAAEVKKYKSIIKKKKTNHDKIVFLVKLKSNSIVLISKALIDLNISHEEFIFFNK